MARLIEVQAGQVLPPVFELRVGDLLMIRGSGGRVLAGHPAVELLGSLSTSVVSDEGAILTPAGGPDLVMFLARGPGRARVEVITGGPWQAPPRGRQSDIIVV